MKKIKCSNFVILANAGIHAGSGKTPLEEMDSRIRGKDNDIFVMYRESTINVELTIREQCMLLGLSVSSYYYEASPIAAEDERLMALLDAALSPISM